MVAQTCTTKLSDAKAELNEMERLQDEANDLWFRLHDIQTRFWMFTPPYSRLQRLKVKCTDREDRRRQKAVNLLNSYLG